MSYYSGNEIPTTNIFLKESLFALQNHFVRQGGMQEYVPALPCDSTELVKFRQRIGKEGIEDIFAMSVKLHGKAAQEKEVIVDTTVQEKKCHLSN